MQMTTEEAPERAPRILIVDDDLSLLGIVSVGLTRQGFDVRTAVTGDQAKEFMDRGIAPDILLTDAMMPGEIQGPDLVEFAKRNWPNMPAVLMSAYAGTGSLTPEKVRDADLIVAKPFQLGELWSKLIELLEVADCGQFRESE